MLMLLRLGQDHLYRVLENKHPDKASKYLYHVFHKLGELERLALRKPLQVRVHGAEQAFILSVRRWPGLDTDHVQRESFAAMAAARLDAVRLAFSHVRACSFR